MISEYLVDLMTDLYCDICGGSPIRAQILIEGAKMLTCAKCMRGGKVLHRFDDLGDERGALSVHGTGNLPPASIDAGEEVIEGCAKLIRDKREHLHLPLSVVAERIKEKESYLHAIESGRLLPTIEVAKKLEKELGVRLVEKSTLSVSPTQLPASGKFSAPTLGDMISTTKKKNK